MPKKSTKSKSKRTTLKQKYKLIKKVKEHHKKKRREENRKKRLGIKPKAPKDPGIPAQWPYKEELMQEIDFEVEKKRAREEAKAELSKFLHTPRQEGGISRKEERLALEAELKGLYQQEVDRQYGASDAVAVPGLAGIAMEPKYWLRFSMNSATNAPRNPTPSLPSNPPRLLAE